MAEWEAAGQLGVFAVTVTTGPQADEVLTLALLGRHAKRGHAFEFTTDEFDVRCKSGNAYAGVDGEALGPCLGVIVPACLWWFSR